MTISTKLAAALAFSGLLVAGTLTTSADAQPRRDEHRDVHREWRHDDRGRAYYGAPPVVYGAPYYAPPPVVYGPGIGINLPGVSINIP
jgi:hypothetical protein